MDTSIETPTRIHQPKRMLSTTARWCVPSLMTPFGPATPTLNVRRRFSIVASRHEMTTSCQAITAPEWLTHVRPNNDLAVVEVRLGVEAGRGRSSR